MSLIEHHLRSGPSAIAILEDQLARPRDEKLGHIPAQVLDDGDGVYYLIRAECMDHEAIEVTFNRALSIRPPIVAFLARDASDTILTRSRATVEATQLAVIARATEQILIGAYDGESFLRWRRRDLTVVGG